MAGVGPKLCGATEPAGACRLRSSGSDAASHFQFHDNAGGSGQRPCIPGPCLNCTEMGLRANCPKLSQPYPFNISYSCSADVMCDSVSSSVIWFNTSVRVNKEKGLAKDWFDSEEPIIVKCVVNQDNSNACRADPTNKSVMAP